MKKVFIILSLLFVTSCSNKELKVYTSNLFYMDTYIEVKIYVNDYNKANKALKEVENIYQKYHNLTNKYDLNSELYYINNNTSTDEWLDIDESLYELLEFGKEWYINSNGLLNINFGSVTEIWKNYIELGTGIPSQAELEKANDTNINNIILKEGQIKNTLPNIDLGSISKGYTTEKVADYLKSIGINTYLINAGGNVIVGDHYNKGKYKIGVQSPNKEEDLVTTIKANNVSVVTSGSYERTYTYNGVIYHHIIDPNTLYPSNYMKSVTIITKDSGIGDALSTTLFLMPIEEGLNFIKNYDADAVWVDNDDNVITTEGFKQYE